MSTTALVMTRNTEGTGYVGASISQDGYPTGAGEQIRLIGERMGHRVAGATLAESAISGGWHYLNADVSYQAPTTSASGIHLVGFGRLAVDMPGFGLISSHSPNARRHEWAYLIGRDGIRVFSPCGRAWSILGVVAWDDTRAMSTIERRWS